MGPGGDGVGPFDEARVRLRVIRLECGDERLEDERRGMCAAGAEPQQRRTHPGTGDHRIRTVLNCRLLAHPSMIDRLGAYNVRMEYGSRSASICRRRSAPSSMRN